MVVHPKNVITENFPNYCIGYQNASCISIYAYNMHVTFVPPNRGLYAFFHICETLITTYTVTYSLVSMDMHLFMTPIVRTYRGAYKPDMRRWGWGQNKPRTCMHALNKYDVITLTQDVPNRECVLISQTIWYNRYAQCRYAEYPFQVGKRFCEVFL